MPPSQLARVNDALRRVERAYLIPGGLPGRPWYNHAIYAPSLANGYACWPLPGIRQAVREDEETDVLADRAAAVVGRLDAATGVLKDAADACRIPEAATGTASPRAGASQP